jgi:LysR family nitrogen assimilation transcriptional regulator
MDLRQLEYFVKVAELGSFTRASVALGIAQPEISRKISQLEVELHQRLFNRNGRGINLTDEGAIMLEHCVGILKQIERMRHDISAARESPIGKVVIGMTASTARPLASGFVTTFRQRFPKASLEIIEGRSRVIQEWVTTGRVDIAIVYDPAPSPLLDIEPLYDIDLFLISLASRSIVPKTGPVPFRSLGKLPMILPAKPHSIRTLVEAEAEKAGIKLDVVLEIEGASLVLELVQFGNGYTVLPIFSMQRSTFPKRLQLNEIVSPRLKRSLKMITSRQHPTSFLMRQTIELIRHSLLGSTGKLKN